MINNYSIAKFNNETMLIFVKNFTVAKLHAIVFIDYNKDIEDIINNESIINNEELFKDFISIEFFFEEEENKAIEVFKMRKDSEYPGHVSDSSRNIEFYRIFCLGYKVNLFNNYSIDDIILEYNSHYNYLDNMLASFWIKVFGKTLEETWNAGIITAHGDKCYGYKDDWKKAGIIFSRGAMLFLLTYTKELGDTPKHESCQWVIDNYQHYLPKILDTEKEVLNEKYHIR